MNIISIKVYQFLSNILFDLPFLGNLNLWELIELSDRSRFGYVLNLKFGGNFLFI